MCFLVDILEINTCIYTFVKYMLRKIPLIDILCRINIISFLISIICWALAIVIFLILFILLLPFAIFKLIIVVFLRAYHNKDYGGVLESADGLWVGENKMAYSIINVALLVKMEKSDQNITQFVKNLCTQRFFKDKRLTSIRKSCMGYGYFLCNQLTADEIVSTEWTNTGEVWDRNMFRDFVQRYSNAPLPRDNTASCELIVSNHPVRVDNTNSDGDIYPILFRVHHSVGDGVTLISMIIQHVSDEGLSIIEKPMMGRDQVPMSLMATIKTSLVRFFKSHAHLLTLLARKDKNALKQPILSGYKRIAFSVERDKVLMGKVKMIKNMVPDGTFTDVVLTGISASLSNYFSKNCKDSPKNLILTFMAIADKKDVRWDHEQLRNIFSMASIRLPIDINKNGTTNIVERYNRTREEYRRSRESCDIRIFYWQLKTFSNILPSPIVKYLIGLNDVTTVSLSNVPGFKKIHIGGNELSHIMFWVPNFVTIGVGFSLVTYDDRFQMGLLVDKNLIPDEDQVQLVLDDVIKYIDLLYEEMCLKPKSGNGVTQI